MNIKHFIQLLSRAKLWGGGLNSVEGMAIFEKNPEMGGS